MIRCCWEATFIYKKNNDLMVCGGKKNFYTKLKIKNKKIKNKNIKNIKIIKK